jgi:hypothetical protein
MSVSLPCEDDNVRGSQGSAVMDRVHTFSVNAVVCIPPPSTDIPTNFMKSLSLLWTVVVFAAVATAWVTGVQAWAPPPSSFRAPPDTVDPLQSRRVFGSVLALAWTIPTTAAAKDVDSSVKGTKKDPTYEACLSKCVYECTKPKGTEQKSRAVCLPECKQTCATNKEQLMLGQPLKKE